MAPVRLDRYGHPTHALVRKEAGPDGTERYVVAGPAEHVEAKRQEIATKKPALKWEEAPGTEEGRLYVEMESQLDRIELRRLAAKVPTLRVSRAPSSISPGCRGGRWPERSSVAHPGPCADLRVLLPSAVAPRGRAP